LIWQNNGYFFWKRDKVTTIWVDDFSRLSFVYLQESMKGDQRLAGKRAFEAYTATHREKILHYHANNGRSTKKLFLMHRE
jgi:hypothetical protein